MIYFRKWIVSLSASSIRMNCDILFYLLYQNDLSRTLSLRIKLVALINNINIVICLMLIIRYTEGITYDHILDKVEIIIPYTLHRNLTIYATY